jgi:hypothetical protein
VPMDSFRSTLAWTGVSLMIRILQALPGRRLLISRCFDEVDLGEQSSSSFCGLFTRLEIGHISFGLDA